jgi:uroporphyrinogen-III synthase
VRVVVTTAAEGAGQLAERLRRQGLDVAECPLIRIEPLPGPRVRAADYDWVVLTSARAVELLSGRLDGPLPRAAVIGPGTASALRELGVEPALVATHSTQEGLVDALRSRARAGERLLFAGAEGARDVIADELGADVVVLYRTVALRPPEFPEADLVVVASASAARALAALGITVPCVSIGPVTSAAARELGLRVVAEAPSHDLDGLVEAVTLVSRGDLPARSCP